MRGGKGNEKENKRKGKWEEKRGIRGGKIGGESREGESVR